MHAGDSFYYACRKVEIWKYFVKIRVVVSRIHGQILGLFVLVWIIFHAEFKYMAMKFWILKMKEKYPCKSVNKCVCSDDGGNLLKQWDVWGHWGGSWGIQILEGLTWAFLHRHLYTVSAHLKVSLARGGGTGPMIRGPSTTPSGRNSEGAWVWFDVK